MRSSIWAGIAVAGAALAQGLATAAERSEIHPAALQSVAAASSSTQSGAAHTPPAQSGLNFGRHDSNAPINIASDNFVGDFTTKVGTYVGNVVVVQADYKMRSDRLKVDVVQGKLNKLEAEGRVVFDSASGTAIGNKGVYNLAPPRTITLTGQVVLTKQKDVMRGTVLVINVDTGQARLTAQGMPGNRVQSLFVPAQHSAPSKPVTTPQK